MRELQVLGNGHLKLNLSECKEFFTQELAEVVRWQLKRLIEEALLAERDRYLNLGVYEHAPLTRLDFRNGFYFRDLVTKLGVLCRLRVLKVRDLTAKVRRRTVLVAYGVLPNGKREMIDYQLAHGESETAWLEFLQDLFLRGLEGKNLQLIVTDGGIGLRAALPVVYPRIPLQLCWAHKMRNIANKVSRQEGSCVAEAAAIYRANSKSEALRAFRDWKQHWEHRPPRAVACVERDLESLLNFFAVPEGHWKFLIGCARSAGSAPRGVACTLFLPILGRAYTSANCLFSVYAWTNLQGRCYMATVTQTAPIPEMMPVRREAAPVGTVAGRNVAVDAYRGLVMLLMMAEVLQLSRVSAAYPASLFWKVLAWNQTHTEWFGCSLHDTIQPGFSFLVGVALPYSIASRMAKGARFAELFWHALWRSFVLAALGVFLRSMNHSMTYFTFEDTLSQIGFGYPFLFLLGYFSSKVKSLKWVWVALALILFAYWLAWAVYPAAPANFDWQSVGVPAAWNAQHNYTGFAAHWNKNYNFGNRFDQWFLNLFPREHPFVYNEGGYLTLSFIPTLGTMILGLIAGRWLRESWPKIPLKKLVIAGVVGIALGLALHYSHIAPVVKRIWTPSWTIFSGGICFLFLAAFSWVIELKGFKKWAFPLVVIGMNSIVAYCIAHFMEEFLVSSFRIHLGPDFFAFAGAGLQPFFTGVAILLCYWFILLWMYRRKLFLKI